MKTKAQQIINRSQLTNEEKAVLLEAVRDSSRFRQIANACVASTTMLCEFDGELWRPVSAPINRVRALVDKIPHVEEDA